MIDNVKNKIESANSIGLKTIRSVGGIINPFDYLQFCIVSFEYEMRFEEIQKFMVKYKGFVGERDIFTDEVKKLLMIQMYASVLPLLIEYRKYTQKLIKKYTNSVKGGDYSCEYDRPDLNLILRFKDRKKRKKSIEIEINGMPFLKRINENIRLADLLLASHASSVEISYYQRDRIISKDEPEKLLYNKAYFEFYLRKTGDTKSSYSLKRALEDANRQYRYLDEESLRWTDHFDNIYNNFKKWARQQAPFLIKILRI